MSDLTGASLPLEDARSKNPKRQPGRIPWGEARHAAFRREIRKVLDMESALRAILEFTPGVDTYEPHDEWGEAEAWRVARALAASALGVREYD